jgi:hypothetical protein
MTTTDITDEELNLFYNHVFLQTMMKRSYVERSEAEELAQVLSTGRGTCTVTGTVCGGNLFY